MDKVVRFVKLLKQDFQFVGIVGCRHLPEIIGGRQRTADHPFDGIAEMELADFLGRSRAIDGAEHSLHFIRPQDGQIGSGEGAAPQNAAEGISRAGSDIIGPKFQVARVVYQGRGDGQFELAGIHSRLHAGGVPAFQQQHEANRRLQRVLQIVVAQIDGRVIGLAPREESLDVLEYPPQPRQARARLHHRKLRLHKRRHRRGIFGINGGNMASAGLDNERSCGCIRQLAKHSLD